MVIHVVHDIYKCVFHNMLMDLHVFGLNKYLHIQLCYNCLVMKYWKEKFTLNVLCLVRKVQIM